MFCIVHLQIETIVLVSHLLLNKINCLLRWLLAWRYVGKIQGKDAGGRVVFVWCYYYFMSAPGKHSKCFLLWPGV